MAEDEYASEACATCSLQALTSPISHRKDIQHNGLLRDHLWNILMACHLSMNTL